MAGRGITIALLALTAVAITFATDGAAAHPFDKSTVHYAVKVADNRPGVASDLGLGLRFAAPSALPEPFGGIVHRAPAAWAIAADEAVPDGDGVAWLELVLDNPLIMGPLPCPAAPIPPLWLKVPLADASSDSSAPDYPLYLPPGEHRARWTGRIEYGETVIPVNVLLDTLADVAHDGDALRLFIGTGTGPTGLPPLDQAALSSCFSLGLALHVAGRSTSGVPVATNPQTPGVYTFAAAVTSKPDPKDPHRHTIVLTADVAIKSPPLPISYRVGVADPNPGVPADLSMGLRFGAKSPQPEPFGGIVHRAPAAWALAADEAVPDGDGVGRLTVGQVLPRPDDPWNKKPIVCPAVMPPPPLVIPLFDASSDSTAPDYPPFLPPGDHKARWTGYILSILGPNILVNVLLDSTPEGDTLRLFVGTGEGPTGIGALDVWQPSVCFPVGIVLEVAGRSTSGVPVATNPQRAGIYSFVAEVTLRGVAMPALRLKAEVNIKSVPPPPPPIGYGVQVRDRNPAVASDLLMGLHFSSKSPLPEPFGGISHRAPPEWRIAADEAVPDGDRVGGLHVRLNFLPILASGCPIVLPAKPPLALSVPLHDASSDSTAPDYPPFLPPGEHQARWAGFIGHPEYGLPVNVLVDEAATGGTTMQVFVGRGRYHLEFLPLPPCLALDALLGVNGHSSSGAPVAVNPAAVGRYSFQAHVITLPKPTGEPKRFDLKAEVVIEPAPPPAPCKDCPPGDLDGDTIKDEHDLCPQEPEDLDEHDVSDGCPDSGDADRDELVNLMELLNGADPFTLDSDGDGCADGEEVGPHERLGGRRALANFWDFFDTPNPNVTPQRDLVVDIGDIVRVVWRFGTIGVATSVADALAPAPPPPAYHAGFDRGGPIAGGDPWNLNPADGSVSIGDIASAVQQFGHSCAAPP